MVRFHERFVLSPSLRRQLIQLRYFRTNAPLSSSTLQFLNIDVECVNGISATEHVDPKEFYKGYMGGFAPIEQELDVRRRLSDMISIEYFIRDQDERTSGPEVVLIKTHAGAGNR